MPIPRLGQHAPKVVRRLSCVLFLAFVLAPVAGAQSQFDPVIVTGTREPQPLSRSSADIVVIGRERIRDSGADSVEELLRREAGLQVTRNGGPGQSAGYLIRGASASGTVVLVDGVRVGSATLGQAGFEALSLAQIDRIEILRGPASSLYGADAVGGVVQLFTRRGGEGDRATAGAAIGGYGSYQADVGASGGRGAFDYAASVGRERSRGVSAVRPNDLFGQFNPDADGFARNTVNLRLGYTPVPGHRLGANVVETRLAAHFDSVEFTPAPDPSPDFVRHLTTRLTSLDYRGEITRLWTATLQLARSVDDSKSAGTTTSRFRTDREQSTWQNALRFGADQQLVLAYEHLRERVDGDLAGVPTRRNDGYVAGYSGAFAPVAVEASIRRDDNSAYGGNTTGGVGASVELAPGLKARARAGTTYRAPTFNDLYFPFFGIATIRPEHGRSIELGLAWQSATASASATVYRNRVRDLIGFQPDRNFCPRDPAFNFGCAGNVSRARIQGLTLSAAERWGGLAVRAGVDLLDARDADTNARLARRAAHQETLALSYDAASWSLGGSVVDVGSRPDAGVVLGGYAVVDLQAAWRFASQWRIEAKLLNALDHRVEPVRDYQGLGRQAWIGVRYDSGGI